jgi:hypothetical protein
MTDWKSTRDKKLLKEFDEHLAKGETVNTRLMTDDRVLARISDGIYREPSSALRELVANAYDADATRVTIQTDAPRFERITVRDNGLGMTPEGLARLINHIGGSAKRQEYGHELGVASADDATRSPGGRRLIGKIGIGLFSVAQLCREFRIITKRKGDKFRLVADIALLRFDEDAAKPDEDGEIEAGSARIQRVPASDAGAHGTDIILTRLSPPARDLLRSRDIWDRVTDTSHAAAGDTFTAPTYHIGRANADGDTIEETANVPWDSEDTPESRFTKLREAVIGETGERSAKPRLDATLDRYLRTLWELALAAPLDYAEGAHPFDLTGKHLHRLFWLSNGARGSAEEFKLAKDETIRARFGLSAPDHAPGRLSRFEVFVDNIRLARPLTFDGGPTADPSQANRTPLFFAGRFTPDLTPIPAEQRGGAHLAFEAYFLWTPRVVPTEHIGVMVRIADASGTLFDDTFIGYQVAERTRLAQISGEVFTLQGLDAALNIDRESFNFGHPHAKIVASWVHRALRQIATTQKRVSKEARDARRQSSQAERLAKTDEIVEREVEAQGLDEAPKVELLDDSAAVRKLRRSGVVAFERSALLGELAEQPRGTIRRNERDVFEKKFKAAIQVLDAYGLLDRLTYAQQRSLLAALAEIFGEPS